MGSTAQFGLICFLLFFGLSQVFQWMQGLTLPLPFFVVGGALLAIASNFDRRAGFPFNLLPTAEEPSIKPPTLPLAHGGAPAQSSTPKSPREVSFTIRKPEKLDR